MSIAARLVLLAVIAAAVAGGLWRVYVKGDTAGYTRAQAEYQAQALEAERQARAAEKRMAETRTEVEKRYAQETRAAAAAADAARSELDQLRVELAGSSGGSTPSNPAAPGRPDGATGLVHELLGHCAEALTGLAGEADRLEARVVGLQAYIRGVCLPAK